MRKIEIEKHKNHSIVIRGNEYSIFWSRGKEILDFDAIEELVEKSRKSDKDALEVMFYLENKRWPKEYELKRYNKIDIKKYVGDGFLIYEENGKYEIIIERDHGKGECYPITKELKEKALKSPRGAYEVMIYVETGEWPPKNPEEHRKEYIRKYPILIFIDPEIMKKIFSKEEYEQLVKLAKEEQEKEKVAEREKEEIRENPELILRASVKIRNTFSKEEIECLETQANEIIKTRKEKKERIWSVIIAVVIILLLYKYVMQLK
jgi:hypothetical protein